MNRLKYLQSSLGWGVLTVALALATTSCWDRRDPIPPHAPVVKPAAAKPSPGPLVDEAGKKGNEADAQAAITAVKLSDANTNAATAQAQMREALAEVERLRKQKSASENELLALYNRLVGQDKQLGVMMADISSARDSLEQERKLRQEANSLLSKARQQIEDKDNEVSLVRFQLDLASQDAKTNADIARRLNDQLVKARSQASTAEGRVTTWFRIAMALLGVFILSLCLHVVRSYIRI